ncbi:MULTISPECIES: single-stranded DNA-binding protein [unclassified Fusibacter]|uniref:single-stranded DNA-binding protein n=1 Tax=unclassified Fusibacter TaxID=2624464 RepID=UPI001012DD28|nr:single-stranded DNA-binding protein [Fusibacter sp. A1]MCK8060877.1 single-stranded DNA-binding protein [Fusibacter sp. A2]NPE23173.1 single-stranded DNA-binding protein [Fusibacter sp. A1]RXV59531.1 single-stranded DNA-binding protein [Fusibacter sp. A1]
MNSVALIGRLTKDPELRFISGSGMAVAQFTLAVDKNLSRDKKQQFEQQGKPTADFIRIVVWGKQAENCANYLEKGRRVAIQGSIQVSSYKSNSGETRYTTDVVASNVEFIDWGDKKPQGASQQQQKPAGNFQAFDDDFANDFKAIEDDDDIPF